MTSNSDNSMVVRFAFEQAHELLATLLRNPRASLAKLADDVGTSRQVAWRALNKLEGETVQGYATIFDEHAVGWRRYLLMIKFDEVPTDLRARRMELRAETSSWDTLRVFSEFVTIGDPYDAVVDIAVASAVDARAYQKVVEAAFGGAIETCHLMEIVEKNRDAGVIIPEQS